MCFSLFIKKVQSRPLNIIKLGFAGLKLQSVFFPSLLKKVSPHISTQKQMSIYADDF